MPRLDDTNSEKDTGEKMKIIREDLHYKDTHIINPYFYLDKKKTSK